jgi:hypothetical protein
VALGGAHLVNIFHFCVVLTFTIYFLCIFLMGPLANNEQNIEVSPFGLWTFRDDLMPKGKGTNTMPS